MASDIVMIKPKEGSRKFKAVGGTMTNKYVENRDGKDVVKNTSQFKSERFPKTRQIFRPIWSFTKRKYMLEGFEENSEKLNNLVKQCKLKYKDDHPKAKQYIEEADIYDFDDPFFNHKGLKVIADEGTFMLDKKRPFDQIILAGLLKNKQFQRGGENNPVVSGMVKYIIVDTQIDQQMKREARKSKMEVYELYKSLSDDKRMKIAMAMNLITDESMDRGLIDDLLFQAAEDTSTMEGLNKSKQDVFVELCKMDPEVLNIRHLTGKAKIKGFLRYRSDQGYLLFGKPVSKDLSGVYDYLADEENSNVLLRLQEALEK